MENLRDLLNSFTKEDFCSKVNLHIHTKYSDGELDEFEIISAVDDAKITEFAIADHDTIEGSKRVYNILNVNNLGLTFHPSVLPGSQKNEPYCSSMDFFTVYQRTEEDARVSQKVVDKRETNSYNT